jgi:DNA gyrase subunit A
MAELAKEIIRVNIEDEMRQSYLDYAMSVIVGRALPDVRDGLKPVHRRVLYGMQEANNVWNRAYVKCARVVGEVMGKYHPHGDSSIYDALVRMAQDFSLRYPLIDGQGNFGSVDGDAAAAMRYTECRLQRLASFLLADIDKDTVDFVPNYDEKESEPSALPARIPNLLINGSAGIAVGMATNIPPHNLHEVIDAIMALIDDSSIGLDVLMQHIPGPDFPTGGIINGAAGILEAYRTGRGRILVRAKTEIEVDGAGRETIIVTELPYQVNKARLIEKIAELHKEKIIEGISSDGLRDESDKDGMRIVIEVRKDTMADVLLNNLFQQTQMQVTFGINTVALVDGQPRLLTLKEVLEAFVRHRREVVTRRTIFELRKARDRAHIVEGLTVALANIDRMIEVIRTSQTPQIARERLLGETWEAGSVRALLAAAGSGASRPETLLPEFGLSDAGYRLSEAQAKEILEMRLNRLTGLEQEKLSEEFKELLAIIGELISILENPDKLMQVIREELMQLKEEFGDARRTVIQPSQADLDVLDLIEPEDVVVTMSHAGYAKRQPVSIYRAQKRGGKGRMATAIKEEDFVEKLWIANTHDTLLAFTSAGRALWLRVHKIPDAGPGSRGKPIVNLLPLEANEHVQAILPVRDFPDDRYVFFSTRNGTVKKTPLSDYSRPRANGIRAIDLNDDDGLVNVAITDGSRDVFLFASNGKAVRFAEDAVRPMGRTAHGVRGIRLTKDAHVVSMIVADGDGDILTATQRGFGKRTELSEYPRKGRGTQGVIAIQCSERNGSLVGAVQLDDAHGLMLISNQGTLVRTRAAEIARVGRNTQGVTLIRLPQEENLVGVVRIEGLTGEVDEVSENGETSVDTTPPLAE